MTTTMMILTVYHLIKPERSSMCDTEVKHTLLTPVEASLPWGHQELQDFSRIETWLTTVKKRKQWKNGEGLLDTAVGTKQEDLSDL